jgi:hypothetical protein
LWIGAFFVLTGEQLDDGKRMVWRIEGSDSRSGILYFPYGVDPIILAAMASLKVRSVTIDGQGVVCDTDGLSSFDKLHSQVHNR